MNILLTGGTGFLGKLVTQKLANVENTTIFSIYHNGKNHYPSEEKIKFFHADLTNIKTLALLKNKIPKIDKIIHLAALVPKVAKEDMAEPMYKVNIMGTVNLLEVFGKDIQSIIYGSTVEVYGLPDTKSKIDENFFTNPLTFYAASKLAGEDFCEVFSKKYGTPVTILRFTVLFGREDRIDRAIPNFIFNAMRGDNPNVYGGKELRDYLYIEDAADAIQKSIIKNNPGIYNIGSGKGITIKKLAQKIINKTNKNLTLTILPAKKKPSNIVLNINKAKKTFGFSPSCTLDQGLDEIILSKKIISK